MVVVQVSGAALVPGVGNGAGDVPHLLTSFHVPQGVLAEGDSVSTVGAATGWLEEKMGPSFTPPSSLTPFPSPSTSTPISS